MKRHCPRRSGDIVAFGDLISPTHLEFPDRIPSIDLDEVGGDAEKAANHPRLRWQVPRGPIRDLFEVIERAGIFVIHFDFGVAEVDGLYQKVIGVPPVLWVNSRKPLDRVRWNASHELGHLMLHEDQAVDETVQRTRRMFVPRRF